MYAPECFNHQHDYPAAKCIDGDTETPGYDGGNMCHTASPHPRCPWFAIDYGTSVTVTRVEIFNRDTDGERAKNVDVRVSDQLPGSASQMFSGGSLLGQFTGPATDGQHIIISGYLSTLLY